MIRAATKKFFLPVISFALLLFLAAPPLYAQIYKYQGQDGKIYFTSNPASIPEGAKILKAYESKKPDPVTTREDEPEEALLPATEPAIQVLQTVLQLYHATHTYSEPDFFVCADMAVDVWNMVETKGINARIAVGNIANPSARWEQFNHTWVVAATSPQTWIALETTNGGVVPYDTNKNYYRGYFFTSPKEFKAYASLYTQASELSKMTQALQTDLTTVKNEYDQALNKHNKLVDDYNQEYANRALALRSYKKAQEAEAQINQHATVVKELEGRGKQLVELINANMEKLERLAQKIDQPIETLPFN